MREKHPTVAQSVSIRDALVVMDAFAKGICYVVEDLKIIGLLTDGDIRRALLRGASIDDSVDSVMNKNFVSFSIDADTKIIRERFSTRIRYIPLVDENGVLVDIADPSGNFRIPVLEPKMLGNELKYVTECIETNWISSQGKYVRNFEKVFEELHPRMHALAVSNGSVALHLALVSLGVSKGDEVIVPNITFAASANAIIHAGAHPVFCEIDKDSWCIDPIEAEKLITPNTKAIMPVHLYGQPCNMNDLLELCREHQLFLVEDCAEALGSEWKSRRVGTFGDAAAFSFFGNKTISTGEGGMILFGELEIAERARIMRDHGMSPVKRYWHERVGYNYRLTNLQAAIGVAQMEKFPLILEKKLKIARVYKDLLDGIDAIAAFPKEPVHSLHSNWLFSIILAKGVDRDFVMSELLCRGVDTRPVFYPLHQMPPYHQYRGSLDFTYSDSISSNGLSLPSSSGLTHEEMIAITDSLREILQEYDAQT